MAALGKSMASCKSLASLASRACPPRNVVGIVGVPFEKGQCKPGTAEGPKIMREHGLMTRLQDRGIEYVDYGDVTYEPLTNLPQVPKMRSLEHVASCCHQLSKKVQEVLQKGHLCLTLGGDHSIAIGSVDAHLNVHQDVALVWVDAHTDINTPLTTPTGNIHGMPVAVLCKELTGHWPPLPGMEWQTCKISCKNIGYIGVRDIDDYERLILDKLDIAAYGAEDVQRLGVHEVVQQLLHRIDPTCERSLHLSLDVDAMDSSEAPATGTPVRGGLTLREAIVVAEECHGTRRLRAVDVVEVNPCLSDPPSSTSTAQWGEAAMHTARAAVELAVAACGSQRTHFVPRARLLPSC